MVSSPSYRPKVQIGSLRKTTKSMMSTKTSGAKVGDTTLKKFLKEDKGLRRMAYGDKSSTVESWKGRHFMKEAKEKIEGSSEVRESFYGKKHTAEQAFRDTVKEEFRQEQAAVPAGPSKDELMKERRLKDARGHLRQYERADEIRKNEGDPLGHDEHAPTAGHETMPTTSSSRPVQLTGRAGHVAQDQAATTQANNVSVASGSGSNVGTTSDLPAIFGFRGRVLRLDPIKQTVLIRVLNAPSELAIFIGRDKTITIAADARCWKDRHTIGCTDIRVSDLADARGKILNSDFVADELYVNGGELPDFVVHLSRTEPSVDLPSSPPDELAIG